ncbi:SDR family oxidoreductase [Sphingobium sufflavum]|uniref:SDR family NAD(P)-dependent oxidoreductase n=1 Tax=Sphingobium sufflavum TaxID=1129547 RepID=UPI001F1A815D|nr:SDR family oxidoreductase [Sphingobium sufflavum]MCE7796883.1 SDR family oxidoreductase [Sphingobium sufflavum]
MTARFAGKIAVVTGGAAGLGRAIALAFAREGADLILVDINEQGLSDTAAEIRALGVNAETYRVDLSVEAEIKALGADILSKHDSVDVLVNNAGLAYNDIARGFADLSMERWLYFFAINSVSPVILALALRPALAKAKGVIINQSSMAANQPATAYGITKATLNSMTYALANQLGGDGIRANSVEPGIMETTASHDALGEDKMVALRSTQLMANEGGTADDIANLHVFLASPEGRFINNEVISCDGGNRMRGWRY